MSLLGVWCPSVADVASLPAPFLKCSLDRCIRLYYNLSVVAPFDLDALDEHDPFEIDAQVSHLFKHPFLGTEDVSKSGNPVR